MTGSTWLPNPRTAALIVLLKTNAVGCYVPVAGHGMGAVVQRGCNNNIVKSIAPQLLTPLKSQIVFELLLQQLTRLFVEGGAN